MKPHLQIVLTLGVLAMVGSSAAQTPGEDLVEQFIETTGVLIENAAEIVSETESVRARQVLREAGNLHEMSQNLLDAGRPRQAHAVSRRAREAAKHAVRLARESRGLEEHVRLRLERFREFYDQILDRANEAGDERALRFVREAEMQARRAHDHYRQGNFALALQLAEAADALLGRAARLLFEGGGMQRLDRDLEAVRDLIERTEEQISARNGPEADTARELLQSARESLRRAEDFRDRGQPLQSLHSIKLARRLAGQGASAARDNIRGEDVRQQIERWDERHEIIAEKVADSGSRPAAQALARALHHRDRAGRLLDSEDLEPALRQIKAAFDLLIEARELAR